MMTIVTIVGWGFGGWDPHLILVGYGLDCLASIACTLGDIKNMSRARK